MEKSNLQKKRFWLSFGAIALILLIVIIIFKDQFASFTDWFGAKLSVLNSLVIGAVIAYLLNPLEKAFFKLYKKVKNHKTQKILSISSSYFVVFAQIVQFSQIFGSFFVKISY